jgi:hypothetical protein
MNFAALSHGSSLFFTLTFRKTSGTRGSRQSYETSRNLLALTKNRNMNDWKAQFEQQGFLSSMCCGGDFCNDESHIDTLREIKAFIDRTLAEEQKRVVGVLQESKQDPLFEPEADPIYIRGYNAALTDAITRMAGGNA